MPTHAGMGRREFVVAGAATALATSAQARDVSSVPVIDTHTHLWDLTRPQGAPYPGRGPNTRDVLSGEVYRKELAAPGVVGAIAAEASPWVEDNLWLLEACAKDTIMVGAIGNLRPEAKEFPEYLGRYHKNPLFLGIRYGNIWGYDIVAQAKNPAFIEGLKLMAQAGLVLDVANPKIDLMQATVRVSDAVPNLKIVVEHVAGFEPSGDDATAYEAVLREFRSRPQVWAKVSAFGVYTPIPADAKLGDHKVKLDRLFDAFGEDRVMGGGYGSRTSTDLRLMKEYLSSRPASAAEKFFWRNSAEAYRWVRRSPDQPKLA